MLQRSLPVALVLAASAAFAQAPDAPPQVIVTHPPAALVRIDGAAALGPVPGHPRVQRVKNSRALILLASRPDTEYVGDRQKHDAYYVRVGDTWMTSAFLTGPWAPASLVPLLRRQLDAIATELERAGEVSPVVAANATAAPGAMLHLFVTETPAELVVFAGPPQYAPVDGTRLLRASNADRDVLLDGGTRTYYVRTDGRWLAAPRLDGPWTFAAPDALPPDVAKLPQRR